MEITEAMAKENKMVLSKNIEVTHGLQTGLALLSSLYKLCSRSSAISQTAVMKIRPVGGDRFVFNYSYELQSKVL